VSANVTALSERSNRPLIGRERGNLLAGPGPVMRAIVVSPALDFIMRLEACPAKRTEHDGVVEPTHSTIRLGIAHGYEERPVDLNTNERTRRLIHSLA
jgi:hypothetical protein